ncbi:hypothetical protein XO10_02765 [Marinitoga sp. 1135]|uniref:Integral membrane protein DUF95 n=1 Tax=Marinitoga piezophila (strain DSM 14283 / JCM 11233 / KA3) TaxID=443254 RepID=H2J5C3_MARPK|nr:MULTISPECIES: integral membrane protein [Marinitoga]AEX84981.1 Integral membrane protein DUF95 [Marinitoga piezophila KA3]APT75486.1 hypothetical protein LN42_03080 [Marinitoga sp. 1137]NUU95211.1 hypothetical protein [Marinitoga sp. 1135]NUU97144.1 hypothetical protein [Marinitoga sp. 1138]
MPRKRHISIYLILYLFLCFELIYFYDKIFCLSGEIYAIPQKHSFKLAIDIILNNLKNFISYIFLFPLMPVFWIIDLFSTTWSIYIGIKSVGLYNTFDKLFPHIVIEFPNYIIYSYISYCLMLNFYRFKYNVILKIFSEYKSILLINIFSIIISGFVEGLIS